MSSIFVLASFVLPVVASAIGGYSHLQHRQVDGHFDWSTIEPSRHLQYHDCYDDLKCARLKVPLDWTKENSTSCSNDSKWAAIAIVTLPATVPEDDPRFSGTILVNPGGPGGSGTEMVLEMGLYLQAIISGEERSYEILGFDPRGVAWSTPRADCYDDDLNRALDTVQRQGLSPVGAGLSSYYQAAQGLSALCAESEGAGPDSIFNHMSTASVARDMLEIVERVDELRYANSTLASPPAEREPPKLQYLGVSYGTILGNTFASMFPGRVGRMVLDGVADADDYVQGTWAKNLNDSETLVDHFYEVCFRSGDSCALRESIDSSAADIRDRVDSFIQTLVESPISTVYGGRARLVTSVIVRDAIRVALYTPLALFEPLSIMLADALAGNYTLILNTPSAASFHREEVCVEPSEAYPQPDYTWFDEAGMGVLCGDSAFSAGERNVSWAQEIVKTLEGQSPTFAEPWSRIPLSCSGWEFRPKYTFRGPFGNQGLNASEPENRPAAPLLILSTRHDLATPLASAEALSKKYPGSAVVVQESYGHCALLASVSECTANHVRTYFATGEVPIGGSTCAEDCSPEIPSKACPPFVVAE